MKTIYSIGMAFAAVCVMASAARAAELPAALVDPYLTVQAALASDKFEGVVALASDIEKAAGVLGKDGEAVVAAAKKLVAAKDIAAARTAFGDVSAALVAYADKTKSTFPAGVRQAFCPMVSKPWLQKDKDIKNPYYGSAMLSCGSFKNN
jgi:hypothetical protein